MCNVGCAKILLFFFNFVFWLAGAVLLAFGIWMKMDSTVVENLKYLNISGVIPLVSHAATIFIIGGAFVFVIGFLGCCGAIKEQQALLFVYAALLIIIMAVEITAAVLVLINRHQVENALKKEMHNEIQNNYTGVKNDTITDVWDALQKQLKCCGADSFRDYQGSKWYNSSHRTPGASVPDSCCRVGTNNEYVDKVACMADAALPISTLPLVDVPIPKLSLSDQGCYKAVMDWFKNHSMIMMIIGFVVASLEIFGLLAACCLRSALKNPEGKVA